MKATINESGTLEVLAQSPLEAFALKKWSESFESGAEVPIICDLNFEDNK